MNITISLQGDKELMAKLKRLENPAPAIQRGMENYVTDIQKKVTAYPPETIANRSPGVNGYSWYVRRDGVHTITGKRYRTSQDMANSWTFETRRMGGGVRTTILNDATYSDFVVGKKQVWYHANRGWIKVPKFIEASKGQLVRAIGKEIDKELNK